MRLDDVGEAAARRVEDRAEVLQRDARPAPRAALDERRRSRVEPDLARAEHEVRRRRSPGCTGPMAAGRAAWSRSPGGSWLRSSSVAGRGDGSWSRRRTAPPSRAPAASRRRWPRGRVGRGGRGLGQRRIERPEGRPGARTGRRAGRGAARAPAERHELGHDRGRGGQRGRWRRRGRRPGRARSTARAGPAAARRRGAPTRIRTAPSPRAAAPASNAANTLRRRDAHGRRDEQQARRSPPREPRQRRHALAASLDERRAAREEERHVRAEARGREPRRARRSRSAPHASSAASMAAAASDEPPPRPGRDRDALLEPGRERAAPAPGRRPAATDGGPGGRDRAQARGCRRAGPGSKPVDVERCPRGRPARREAQPVGQGERDHHRVQVVEAVGAPAEDRERQVELRRREPDDRRRGGAEPGPRVGGPPRGPCRAARAPRAARATPPPRASAAGGRGRCRPSASAPRRRASRVDRQLPARARCGASCGARGTPAWTSRHSSSSVVGVEAVVGGRTARRRSPPSRPSARARTPRGGTWNAIRTRAWYWTNTDR